jgi:hypothetical protein
MGQPCEFQAAGVAANGSSRADRRPHVRPELAAAGPPAPA